MTRLKKLVDDPDFAFLFRLAFTLKKSVKEILDLPEWERETWKAVFTIYGPLDWKREDLLLARVNQYQAAGGSPLRDFILFRDPTEKAEERKQTEEDVLKAFGYTGE